MFSSTPFPNHTVLEAAMDQFVADQVLVALRRITRAIDLHSRALVASHGLTVPQLVVLKQLGRGDQSVGELSRAVNLSAATVTSILNRLVSHELVARKRSHADRRVVVVELTEKGRSALTTAPGLLRERFASAFSELADWEQSQMLSSLQRVAAMMDAGDLDPEPSQFLEPNAAPDPPHPCS